MPGLIAEMSRRELDELKREFPAGADTLDGLAELTPNKALIPLSAMAPEAAQALGTRVLDRLYRRVGPPDAHRFLSYYYQFREIAGLPRSETRRVLEVGPGEGLLTAWLRQFDYDVTTLDVDAAKAPDVIGSVTAIPCPAREFDLVCAFEVLQHLPFERFQESLAEMARCARSYVFFSLPYPGNSISVSWRAEFRESVVRRLSFRWSWAKMIPGLMSDRAVDGSRARREDFRPHYWEVNRRSYPRRRVLDQLPGAGLRLLREFHNPWHPYHYFVLCRVEAAGPREGA